MNWREIGIDGNDTLCRAQTDNNPLCRDHFYDYPNLDLMPGLASPSNEWFNFIKQQNLKTYVPMLHARLHVQDSHSHTHHTRTSLPLCPRTPVFRDSGFYAGTSTTTRFQSPTRRHQRRWGFATVVFRNGLAEGSATFGTVELNCLCRSVCELQALYV